MEQANYIETEKYDELVRLLEDRRDLVAAHERDKRAMKFKRMNLKQKLAVLSHQSDAVAPLTKRINELMQG